MMIVVKILITILLLIFKPSLFVCFTKCLENEFQCPLTGNCIDKLMICDGFIDCLGYHDEFNCSTSIINSRSLDNPICPGFLCKDSDECLTISKVCNGLPDCPNGGDELNCPIAGITCVPNCDYDKNQNITITRCLNVTSICDGIADCYDGLDEVDCDQMIPGKRNDLSNNQSNETIYINCNETNSFNCGDDKCINKGFLCNGKIDCPNGLDEGISCNLNLTCETRSCAQRCVPLVNGSKCDCQEGYQLLADGQTCEDIDECSTGPLERPCFHECINTLGSYRCDCFEGWSLSTDDKTCVHRTRTNQCKVNSNDPFLLMVKDNAIYINYFRCISSKSPIVFTNLSSYISTFTFDQANWRIYYYSVPTISINLIDVVPKVTSKFVKLNNVARTLKSLIFDDLTGNLYWIEPTKGLIQIVSTRDPNQTVITLIDDLTDSHQIALNQERGEMYISITGFEPKILVASLHGKDIREIDVAGPSLIYPSALFVDKMGQRLFWSDSGTHEIYFVSLSTRRGEFGPKEVIFKLEETVQSMIIHDDKIYLATKEGKLIQVDIADRDWINDRKYLKIPIGGASPFNDIDLFYGFDYRYRSPCLNDDRGGCSHVCTFIDSVVTCLCPKGMTLDTAGRVCVQKRIICPPDSLICADGSDCFKVSTQCDGHFDCLDKSDEANCTSMKNFCPENYDLCPIGSRCIPKTWFCDSYFDCPDGLDEKDCRKLCKSTEFNCGEGSNQCIPGDWVCDEIVDCANKADEANCVTNSR